MTEAHIRRLRSLGFQGVYIGGNSFSEDESGLLISDETREHAVEALANTFSSLARGDGLKTAPLRESVDAMLQSVLAKRAVLTTLTGLRTHDNYTFEHSVNVAVIALMLGQELRLDVERLRVLGLGALLHDVGKVFLAPTILRKPAQLTEVEYRNVQQHPRLGYEILSAYDELDPVVAQIAYQHHERLDGRGYPRSLKKEQIEPLAKIVTVADVFDALTADRVYRKGMPTSVALNILTKEIDVGYDRDVVESLLRRVAPYSVGERIRLNTGEVGTVIIVPQEAPNRPTVQVERSHDGGSVVYHLRHEPALSIVQVLPSNANR